MRFLIDESADARLVTFLASLGHDAITVAAAYRPGLDDARVLEIANADGRVLITDDRDFGDLVFRSGADHRGVIYFRLNSSLFSRRLERLKEVLERHSGDLGGFLVVSDRRIRVRRRH